jgi:hypothetical protein
MIFEESFKTKLMKYAFNLMPVFRATGAWITHINSDMRLVKLKLPLNLKTKNPLGTMCGGNMYSSVHGIYSVMLIKNLGRNYLILDRTATIRFLKPGRGTLYTQFEISESEISEIKSLVDQQGKIDRQYLIELKDQTGLLCGDVVNTIHIRRKPLKAKDGIPVPQVLT